MSKEIKPNDWLVSTSLNPGMDLTKFEAAGLNGDNTQMLTRDEYKNTSFVQDNFKTEDGKFDEVKFNKVYDQSVKTYDAFINDKYSKNYIEELDYSFSNTLKPIEGKVRTDILSVKKLPNPFRSIQGFQGLGSVQESGKGIAELAQNSKVKDYETGETLNYTPNDKGGLSGFVRENLVIARYDEDGEHVNEYGEQVKHKAGELKLNEDGDFYYETLGNRDASKKQVLSAFDTLTVDGSLANKFDAFDGDDKDQNITKTIARGVLKYLPAALGTLSGGGKVATAISQTYLGANVAFNLLDVLPSISKAIEGITTNNEEQSKRSTWWNHMNSLQATMGKYKTGVSEYSQNNMITWENVFNMIPDIGLQLGQQKWIAQLPGYLNDPVKGAKTVQQAANAIQKQNKISKELASAYMVITSGADSYNSAIQAGHDPRAAGLIMLGTLGGLYGVMKTDIGQWPLKGIGLDDITTATKKAQQKLADDLISGSSTLSNLETATLVQKNAFMKKVGTMFADRFRNILREGGKSATSAALSEGIEEISEEIVQDLAMGIGQGAAALGVTRKSDWDFFKENPLERYLMSAIGGAVGGAIHKVNFMPWRTVHNSLDEKTKEDLIYGIWQYGADEINKAIEKSYKNKSINFGSRDLSASRFETIENGRIVFLDKENEQDSQAYKVKEDMKNYVNTVNEILKSSGAGVADLESRKALEQLFGKDRGLTQMLDMGLSGRIKEHLADANTKIINLTEKIEGLNAENGDSTAYATQLAEIKQYRNSIVNGEHFDSYFNQGLLFMNSDLSKHFIDRNIEDYTKHVLGKDFNSLGDTEKAYIKDVLYRDYKQNNLSKNLEGAAEILMSTLDEVAPTFNRYNKEYKQTRDLFYKNLGGFTQKTLESLDIFDSNGSIDPAKISKVVDINQVGLTGEVTDEMLLNAALESKREYYQGVLGTLDNMKANSLPVDSQVLDEVKRLKTTISKTLSVGSKKLLRGFNRYQKLNDMSVSGLGKNLLTFLDTAVNTDDILNLDFVEINKKINDLTAEDINLTDGVISNYNLDEDFEEIIPGLTVEGELAKVKEELKQLVNDLKTSITEDLNFINQVESSISGTIDNPIYELLGKLSTITGSETQTAIDILKEESKRLNTIGKPLEYLISSENKMPLKNLLKDIEILQDLVLASMEDSEGMGHVQKMNEYRKKYTAEKIELPVLDQQTARLMSMDLHDLQVKVKYFVQLSEYNESDKLRELKKVGGNFTKLFYKLYDENNPLSLGSRVRNAIDGYDLLEGLEQLKVTNIDEYTAIETTLDLELSGSTLTPETYAKSEMFLTKVEDLIFNNFQKILKETGLTQKETIEKLYKAADFGIDSKSQDSIINARTSELTSKTEQLTDFDQWVNFISTLSTKSSDYKTCLYQKLNASDSDGNPIFKFAPVFSQEYPARLAYGMINNPEIFNDALFMLKDERGKFHTKKLGNLLYINGYHGTGKTSATANLIHLIVKEKYPNDFSVTSIVQRQADKLADSLNESETLRFTKDELLDNIFKSKSVKSLFDEDGNLINSKLEEVKDNLEVGKVIYIDEVTHYSTQELEALTAWAGRTGRVVIAYGDDLQQGATKDITYVDVIKSPTMEYSMRSGSTIVKDNNDSLRVLTKQLNELEYDPKNNDNKTLKESTYTNLVDPNVFSLKYYESADGEITGTKFVDKEVMTSAYVNKYILNLIGKGTNPKDICIIYKNKSQSDFDEIQKMADIHKVTIMEESVLQGAEFDHVIVMSDIVKKSDALPYCKYLNTILTRAKYGNLVRNNGVDFLNQKQEFPSRTDISEDILLKFMQERIQPLQIISDLNTEYKTPIGEVGNTNKVVNTPQLNSEPPKTESSTEDLLRSKVTSTQNELIEDQEQNAVEYSKEYFKDGKMIAYTSLTSFGGYTEIDKDGNRRYVLPKNRGIGNFISDLSLMDFESSEDSENYYLNFKDYAAVARELDLLRAKILQSPTTIKDNILDYIDDSFNFNEDLKNDFNWVNGRFEILYTRTDKKIDSDPGIAEEKKPYVPKTKYTKSLIFKADALDGSDDSAIITLAKLGDATENELIKRLDSTAIKKLEISSDNSFSYVIPSEAIELTGASTRLFKSDINPLGLDTLFDEDPQWKLTSRPLIFTGHEPDISDDLFDNDESKLIYLEETYRQSINGKPVILVTKDPMFDKYKDNPELLTSELFNYYLKQKAEQAKFKSGQIKTREYPPKVSLVMLSPKTNDIKTFFTKLNEALVVDNKTSNDKKKVMSLNHKYTALNMLRGMYESLNYLRDQKEYNAENFKIKTQLESVMSYFEYLFGIKQEVVDGKVHILFSNKDGVDGALKTLKESIEIQDKDVRNSIYKTYYGNIPAELGLRPTTYSDLMISLMDLYLGKHDPQVQFLNDKKKKIYAMPEGKEKDKELKNYEYLDNNLNYAYKVINWALTNSDNGKPARFKNGVNINPIYLASSEQIRNTNSVEEAFNQPSEFLVEGVKIEGTRILINYNLVTDKETYKNEEKGKQLKEDAKKEKVKTEINNMPFSNEVKTTLSHLVDNETSENLEQQINSVLNPTTIDYKKLNDSTDTKNPIVNVTYTEDGTFAVESLTDFDVVKDEVTSKTNITSTDLLNDKIVINTESGQTVTFDVKTKSIIGSIKVDDNELELLRTEYNNGVLDFMQSLNDLLLSKQTDPQALNLEVAKVLTLDNFNMSFKEFKRIKNEMANINKEVEFENLLRKKFEIQC